MKKTRILALITAIALSAGMVVGCGSKEQGASDVVELEWWSNDTHSMAFMQEEVKKFNDTVGKENGVKLNYIVQDGGQDKIKVALQNGSEPDFFGVASLSEYAENEYIAPLSDIEGIDELIEKNTDYAVEGTNVYNGKNYLMSVSSQMYGLAYNKDMFKAAGIVDENGEAKPPKTYKEMVEAAKKLTDKSKQQYGIILPLKWNGWYGCEISSNAQTSTGLSSGIYNVQEGKYDYEGTRPITEAILQMKADGSVYPGAEGMDNDPARARFAEGNVGMKFCVTWDIGVWNEQFPAKCDWGIVPAPSVSEDEVYYGMKQPSWSTGVGKRGLEEHGSKPIAVVLNYFYSDEFQIKKCENAITMPYRADIVEQCNFANIEKKGWEDFAKILAVSTDMQAGLPADLSGYESDYNDFINRVWSEEITLDEWIKERNEILEKGVAKYKEAHPDEDYSDRIIPDYNIKLN